MNKILSICLFTAVMQSAAAQKVDSIYFHLYTDSLKKGFYNYINIDGKLTDGSWRPLDASDVIFTCNTGSFRGNDLMIDSNYKAETVTIKAVLKNNPSVWREAIVYIRKRGFNEPLKNENDVLNSGTGKSRRTGKQR